MKSHKLLYTASVAKCSLNPLPVQVIFANNCSSKLEERKIFSSLKKKSTNFVFFPFWFLAEWMLNRALSMELQLRKSLSGQSG